MELTSLSCHIDLEWLEEAFRRTRKDGAPGVDSQTAADYRENLGENLRSLLDRAKSGTYFAPPVKRGFVPKGDKGGELRVIGKPTFEDKVLQRAIAMVLEPVYEQDFLDCSYGFRPKRSPHQATAKLIDSILKMRGCWLLEVDIRKFFDTLDKSHLREMLGYRIRDGVVRRLFGKWLKAGVCHGESLFYPASGCPQGGVISPLASNVYLHYVLDLWFEEIVKRHLRGKATLIRFADDFVVLFEYEEDARRVMEVIPKRFEKYGLAIHPDKTRLINFRRPTLRERGGDRRPAVETFSFLGFAFYWSLSRKGNWIVKRKTAKDRLRRSIRRIAMWCRVNRHRPIKEQQTTLNRKLRGHYNYYGVSHNYRSMQCFYFETMKTWRKWLERRDERGRMPWDKFNNLLRHYPLVKPRVHHSICNT